MKKTTILFAVAALVSGGCEEESFDYKTGNVTVADVARVDFYTGTEMMIADGQATLDFIVEAFREVEMTDADGTRSSRMLPINLKSLPEGSVKIFDTDGNETGPTFSTTDAARGSIGFYAQIGDQRSPTKTVTLRAAEAPPSPLFVDVIFHVFELSPKDSSYDPLTYQQLDYDLLTEGLDLLNKVFNNRIGRGPNGASANITFRMAAADPSGEKLTNPGYNRIVYDAETLPRLYGNSWSIDDFAFYMNNQPGRIWDPDNYLNIVVMPSGANNHMISGLPEYQIVPPGGEALQPVSDYPDMPQLNPIADVSQAGPTVYQYKNTCVGIPVTVFRPGPGRPIALSPSVGKFYGVIGTWQDELGADWCTDTQLYNTSDDNPVTTLMKVSLTDEKFLANNAMDDVSYPSLRNNFTRDQVARIRYVISNCPGRQNGKTE